MSLPNLILAVNAGSSSLKISLFKPSDSSPDIVSLLLSATYAEISSKTSFSFKPASRDIAQDNTKDTDTRVIKKEQVPDIHTHHDAFSHFLQHLAQNTSIKNDQIVHVCHRVVHGGPFKHPVLISDETYHIIEELSDLAPLHNGSALAVIKSSLELLSKSDSHAFFDTCFHQSIPDYASRFPIDQDVADSKGLRKYGFHGLSYSYILRAVAKHLNKPPSSTSLIVLHLGSGASVCAIQNGKSLDTSMGLTPLSGLPGSTRSGSVDPGLIFHYTSDVGKISHNAVGTLHLTTAEEILHLHCGWNAVAGTKDFAQIVSKASIDPTLLGPHPRHTLAYHIFLDRILGFVGSYFLKLGGGERIDAIVFSGGIGERSDVLRKSVLESCACLGFGFDEALNGSLGDERGEVVEIGVGKGGVRTLVCRTDEQLEMARQLVTKSY